MNSAGREQDVNSLLSSCIGFFPTAPLGVNSYYPWGLGRFTQEDAIEGSATLLASQNRYVYCQNDPVSLIDPTGYSPENTGTPSRFGQGNPANYSSSKHACIVSPHDGFNPSKGYFDGELAGKSLPSLSMPGWDGCYEMEDVSHELGENSPFTAKYRMTINGHQVDVYVNEEGKMHARPTGVKGEWDPEKREVRYPGATDEQMAIVNGLNAAFKDINNENLWGTIGDAKKILNDIVSFAKKNMGTFASILSSSGNTTNAYFQFMKHAAIGAVIARLMVKEDHTEVGDDIYEGIYRKYFPERARRDKVSDRFNDFDMEIGFWVSFYNEREGLGMSLMGKYHDGHDIGLIGLATIIKAIIKQESSFNPYNADGSVKIHKNGGSLADGDWGYGYGLMAAGGSLQLGHINSRSGLRFNPNDFSSSKNNNFLNIGAGIGHLVYISRRDYNRSMGNSLEDWLQVVQRYNGTGTYAKGYRELIRERYYRYRGKRRSIGDPG